MSIKILGGIIMKNNKSYISSGFLTCDFECTFKTKSGYCALNSCSNEYPKRVIKKIGQDNNFNYINAKERIIVNEEL